MLVAGDRLGRRHEGLSHEAMGLILVEARVPDEAQRVRLERQGYVVHDELQGRGERACDPLRDREHIVGLGHHPHRGDEVGDGAGDPARQAALREDVVDISARLPARRDLDMGQPHELLEA